VKKAIATLILTIIPVLTYASENSQKSFFGELIIALAPILIIVFLVWIAIRALSKNSNTGYERLLESHERIAKSLEELVSIQRRKDQE